MRNSNFHSVVFKRGFTILMILFSARLVGLLGSSSFQIGAQTLGGVEACPGGSCNYTYYAQGKPYNSCEACCPAGKSPNCSSFGCVCNSD